VSDCPDSFMFWTVVVPTTHKIPPQTLYMLKHSHTPPQIEYHLWNIRKAGRTHLQRTSHLTERMQYSHINLQLIYNNSDIILWQWNKRGIHTCAGPQQETAHAQTHASVPHIKLDGVYFSFSSNPVVHVPWFIKWNNSVTTHITSCAARTPVKTPTRSSLPTCKYQASSHFYLGFITHQPHTILHSTHFYFHT